MTTCFETFISQTAAQYPALVAPANSTKADVKNYERMARAGFLAE